MQANPVWMCGQSWNPIEHWISNDATRMFVSLCAAVLNSCATEYNARS